MSIQFIVTDVGLAELTNATNTGTDPVTISHIALGAGTYTANKTQTALVNQIKQVATISGTVVSDNAISVNLRDESIDTYSVSEIGLITENGTLFAVYSDVNGVFIEKTEESTLMIDVDILFSNIDANTLTFGDTNFTNPNASETVKGVAEIATQTETDTGTDDIRFVTPKKLNSWLKQATETVFGALKIATQTQTDAGADDSVAITPKKLRWGFSVQLAQTGYVILPSWLGGIIFQWGLGGYADNGGTYINYPLTFPNSVFSVVATPEANASGSGADSVSCAVDAVSTSQFYVRGYNTFSVSMSGTRWLAVGY